MGPTPVSERVIYRVLGWSFALLAAGVASIGCDNGGSSRKVSSSLFLAPVSDNNTPGANVVLAGQTDFLVALEPDKLPGEIEEETTDTRVLANLSDDSILVSERRSGSIFSVDFGRDFAVPDCAHSIADADLDGAPDCERVRLHYTGDGFSEALRTSGRAVLSGDVRPIRLKNGWVLAFEINTRSIIAFREIEPREISFGDAGTIQLPFRSSPNPDNLNFGRGNGVIISEVLSETQLRMATGGVTVRSFFELEENKVLIFFSNIAAIHLLELSEEPQDVDFDLENNFADQRDVFPVPLLTGSIKLFPRLTVEGPTQDPFLTFSELATVTLDVNLQLNTFPPTIIPTDGSALLFDSNSGTFLAIRALRGRDPKTGEETDEIIDGVVRTAISASRVRSVLTSFFGPGNQADLLRMTTSFFNPNPNTTEIFLMEETTNNVLAYNYTAPLTDNLRIFVAQADIVNPRDPSGRAQPATGIEPELTFSTADVRDNRLTFDQGLDRLLGVSYTSGMLVVVLSRADLIAATGEAVANLTFVQPLDDNSVRAFDVSSSSLLGIRLRYAAVPIRQQ